MNEDNPGLKYIDG